MPGSAMAQGAQVEFALRPIGQAGSSFDLIMTPGEVQTLEVELTNTGDAAMAARTYAADVYTIVNGGFGGRLRDETQTSSTEWIAYPTEVVQLRVGEAIRRSFTIAVPLTSDPGEYAATLIVENDQPIRGSGAVAMDQIVRLAVPIVVTVPGKRLPALAIGEATHKVVAGRSVVSVAVENSGNIRLAPLVAFTLFNAAGAQVSQASVQMDTFYARTATFIEVPLAALLLPGTYTVQLVLEDGREGVEEDRGGIVLLVGAPVGAVPGVGGPPGLNQVIQGAGDGQIPFLVIGIVLLAGLALGLALGALLFVLRRRARSGTAKR